MTGAQLSLGLEETQPRTPQFFDPVRTPIENGITLIEASAGTGKTHSIVMTLLRLLLERSADGRPRVGDISRVLVVTFTVAATDQLITRVREALRQAVDVFAGNVPDALAPPALVALRERFADGGRGLELLRSALARIDQLAIFTIHGFCKRVLEENALESSTPYDAAFVEDETEMVLQAAHDWWRRTMYDHHQLATLAVLRGWDPRRYIDPLALWRRFPGTIVVPEDTIEDGLAAVEKALAGMVAAWDAARVPALLARMHWTDTAPLAAAASRAFLAESISRIAAGEWRGALEVAARSTAEALGTPKTGIDKRYPADLRALLGDPFIASCGEVEPAIERLEIALQAAFIRDVNAAFETEKRRRHTLGFDDLLRRVSEGVGAGGTDSALARAIRARYDAALIDEFQDTDAYQYPIFAAAFRDRPLFLIGDPKQAIYSFRGADIAVYMRAAAAARRRYTLQNNHRSTSALIHAVSMIFRRAERPFLEEESRIGYVDVRAAREQDSPLPDDDTRSLRWWVVPAPPGKTTVNVGVAEEHFHDAIVREILDLLSARAGGAPALHPREIAILVRSNREAAALQRRLRDAGIQSVLRGSGDILFSEEMGELGRMLAAVATPSNARAVRSAVTTTLWGMDAADLYAFSRPEQEHEWQRLVEALADARETWRRHGFMRMVQELFARQGVAGRLLRLRDGERRLTNVRHAVEQLHAVSEAERLSPEGLLLWLARAKEARPLDAERRELRLESDEDAVQISTIHLSKGLEYGVVFCTSLWNAREPKKEVLVRVDDDTVIFDLGSAERDRHARLAAADDLAESLRLAYVAITRARYRVYLGLAAAYNAPRSALGYLLRPAGSGQLEPRDELLQRLAPAVAAAIPRWPETLDAMCAGSKGTMSWITLPMTAGDTMAPPPASERSEPPRARDLRLGPAQLDTWRISSYTRLATEQHGGDAVELDAHIVDPDTIAAIDEAPLTGFAAFPKGKHPGVVLHSIFEELDFRDAASAATRGRVDAVLASARLPIDDPARAAHDVAAMLSATVASPLPRESFRLRDIAPDATRREWRFHLPLSRITRESLLAPFERSNVAPSRSYASFVRRLDDFDVHGFLTGSVDLLFQHGERWYIMDWKSNDLGTRASCYERPALERAMFASHYTLQYHLYVLALHRYLRTRVAGYDYERHIGGVWYAFLRGIDGVSERGWYHDRPPRDLIEALDDALLEAATP